MGVSTGYRWRSHGNILITPDKGLNGKLDVHSDLPRNNTIRYIEVRVTNEDGNERTVTIEQYPLEYITNIQGGTRTAMISRIQILTRLPMNM